MQKERLTLEELITWGTGRDFGGEELRLDVGSVIIDRNKFYKSHIKTLKGAKDRKNKEILLPFYNRLVRFKELIESEQAARVT